MTWGMRDSRVLDPEHPETSLRQVPDSRSGRAARTPPQHRTSDPRYVLGLARDLQTHAPQYGRF